MAREYFPSKFRLDNRIRYFLWSTMVESIDEDRDEVWTRERSAPYFLTLNQALHFARQHCDGKINTDEPLLMDLDYVTHWLRLKKMKRARQFYSPEILDAWNIFGDLARSLALPFRGDADELTPLWTKLLLGDEHWRVTRWSGRELTTTHEVLGEGLAMWRAHFRRFCGS